MNARITGPERIPEPTEINEALANIFGRNDFGGGLYRMVWGQTETLTVRGPDGKYIDMLVGHNKPAWLLQRWCAPRMFWTPELYYAMSSDESGLSLTGEYPQFGRYDTVIMFIENKIVEGELVIETIPLSFEILESLIPVLQNASEMTAEEMRECEEKMEAEENARKVDLIAERMAEARYAFTSPTNLSGRTAYEKAVEEKKKRIAAEWDKRNVLVSRPKPMYGFYQENIPISAQERERQAILARQAEELNY